MDCTRIDMKGNGSSTFTMFERTMAVNRYEMSGQSTKDRPELIATRTNTANSIPTGFVG